MRERKFGRIFNLTGSTEPPAHLNAGVPPNGAVQLWAKALSRVVGPDGITVNCISPGRIRSEQIDNLLLPGEEARQKWSKENIPVGYVGEPEDLAVLVDVPEFAEGSLHHRPVVSRRWRRASRNSVRALARGEGLDARNTSQTQVCDVVTC